MCWYFLTPQSITWKKNQNGQQTEVLSVIFIILFCGDRDFLDSKRSGGFTPSGRGFSVQQVPLSFKLRDGLMTDGFSSSLKPVKSQTRSAAGCSDKVKLRGNLVTESEEMLLSWQLAPG